MVQGRHAARLPALPPRNDLQGRRVAGAGSLAWHRHRQPGASPIKAAPAVWPGAGRGAFPGAGRPDRVARVVQNRHAASQRARRPRQGHKVYTDDGWQGRGHWLGTGKTGNTRNMTHFLPFGEALAVARSLGPASRFEWQQWSREGVRPRNVPSAPNEVHTDHRWEGWGHLLGAVNRVPQLSRQLLPFAEALAAARSLGLGGQFAWRAWCKAGMRPPTVPAAPDTVCTGDGWQGWGHWLGTGTTAGHATKFLPFGEAKRLASTLQLRQSGGRGAKQACGLPTCPPPQTRSARPAGGRRGATGSAPAAEQATQQSSCRLARRSAWPARSGSPAWQSGGRGAQAVRARPMSPPNPTRPTCTTGGWGGSTSSTTASLTRPRRHPRHAPAASVWRHAARAGAGASGGIAESPSTASNRASKQGLRTPPILCAAADAARPLF